MDNVTIIFILIFVFSVIFYFIYTLSFALHFNKTDTYYNKKQKSIHNTMIWIVPFLWILLLKSSSKTSSGRQVKIQCSSNSTQEINNNWWALGIYSFFHGSDDSITHDGHYFTDTGGHHGGDDWGDGYGHGGYDSSGHYGRHDSIDVY